MTPAIAIADKNAIDYRTHEYRHDAAHSSYGMEAAEKLSLSPARVFKTLVVKLDNRQLAVGVVPVNTQLNLKQLAKALGAKKAAMAEAAEVQRSTGYVLGGVSPLGQKKLLKTVIDSSATQQQTVYVSAGRRGLEIELSPGDLKKLTRAIFADIKQAG
jgi:Cys-tRNA(Pro)/Cys-tRNA(Cys) deacylase